MTNDFQVEFFSFNYQKQWKLSVYKKVINQVRLNGLYKTLQASWHTTLFQRSTNVIWTLKTVDGRMSQLITIILSKVDILTGEIIRT